VQDQTPAKTANLKLFSIKNQNKPSQNQTRKIRCFNHGASACYAGGRGVLKSGV
jgi:hypothetical protein